MAKGIERARSAYCEEKGVGSEREWREKARVEGITCTCMNIGLPTWAETREALGSIYEDALSRGVRPPDRFNLIAERRMGLPKDKRAEAPQETGPVMMTEQDWWELAHTVPIEPEAADNSIGGRARSKTPATRCRRGSPRSASSRSTPGAGPTTTTTSTRRPRCCRRPGCWRPSKTRASSSTPTWRTATRASSTTTPTTSAGRWSSATSAKS